MIDQAQQESTKTEAEFRNQFKAFLIYSALAFIYCVAFSYIYYFPLQMHYLGLLHLFTLFLVTVNPFILLQTKNLELSNSLMLTTATIIVVALFVTGGWGGMGYIWMFGYLPYAFFLAGKHSKFWVILPFCIFLFFIILHSLQIYKLPYSSTLLWNYMLALFDAIFCMFVLQAAKDKTAQLLQQKVEEVSVINRRLDQEIISRKQSEESLQKQTVELEKAKLAMLNVMEDLQADKTKIDEQKKLLDSILANLPVGVSLAASPTGKLLMINRAGMDMIGRGVDPDAEKDNYSEIYKIYRQDGTIYPTTETPLSIALQTGLPITKDDLVIHKPDNSKISLRGTSVPIKNQQGQVISVVTVFEDITKDKEIDRMKTEFISLASHQLRTPLSAIKWFSEMLLGGDAGELTNEQKEFAKNIDDSTERMIQLVNSLLNISRIESGRILVDPKPTNLKELVQGVVTDLKAKIEERKQNLLISVHGELPLVNIDPRLIRQVYLNLLTNAIKYTPKGGEITVFISKKGEDIISQVSDNGYGIPKAQQGRIFQKFFRAENVVKVETDGTGLGLYLIKAIVESSHGKIWFESEEGKGTSFWFSIPVSGMEAKKGEVTLD